MFIMKCGSAGEGLNWEVRWRKRVDGFFMGIQFSDWLVNAYAIPQA